MKPSNYKKGQLKTLIYYILLNNPETRSDDFILYAYTCELLASKETKNMNLYDAFKYHNDLHLPSLHSVIRLRRLIQTETYECKATAIVEDARNEKDKQTRAELYRGDYNG